MDKSEKFWNRSARSYSDQVNEDDEVAIATLDLTRKYLRPNDIVLDFACATGKYAFEIAPQVEVVWGIDISTEMINAAKRNAKDRDIANVQFMQALITDSHLENETFDVILAYNILHLVEDPPHVIEKIKELLKPNGLFISVTPCLGVGRAPQALLIRLASRLGVVPDVHSFKPDQVEALLTYAGFELVATRTLATSPQMIFLVGRKKCS